MTGSCDVAGIVLKRRAIAAIVNVARVIAARSYSFCHCCVRPEKAQSVKVRCWATIADNFSTSGLSWGCSPQIDATGRVLYTADAYRDHGKRFTVIADDKVAAFLELERVTRESLRFLNAE